MIKVDEGYKNKIAEMYQSWHVTVRRNFRKQVTELCDIDPPTFYQKLQSGKWSLLERKTLDDCIIEFTDINNSFVHTRQIAYGEQVLQS